MSKTQFLLFLIIIIPLTDYFFIKIFRNSQKLVNIISKALPIFFLMSLIGLSNTDISIAADISNKFSFGFAIDKTSLTFLFLLNFIWIVFAFYSNFFITKSGIQGEVEGVLEGVFQGTNRFKLFFAALVSVVNFILISKNLLTILFFYNCLLFLCCYFVLKSANKEGSKMNHIFTFIFYLEAVLLFFATVATYKFIGKIDFIQGSIVSDKLGQTKQISVLLLYLSSLFLLSLTPLYLIFRNINFNSLEVYTLFFLGLAFSSLYVFIKIVTLILGFGVFASIIEIIGFSFFEWVFLLNLLVSSALLFLSKDLKSAFSYLFFNQFTFVLFSIFIFAIFNNSKIYLPLISFSLGITLLFLCLSNFILFLSKAQNHNSKGLFYELRINSILLAFAILNLAGIAPALGMFEKFFIIKVIVHEGLFISGIIFTLNIVTLVAFGCKLFYSFIAKSEDVRSSEDRELAKIIDSDSNLILTVLVTVLAILLLPIIFQLKNGIFSL